MVRDLVDYVLVGNSERRAVGETDEHVAKKASAVVDAGLVPIVFVERTPHRQGHPRERGAPAASAHGSTFYLERYPLRAPSGNSSLCTSR
ncbi:MAG: triose-phosphate isomerase [Actinobacteria bacterium]|nr:triose-phosphate isomerase [Actinomycetota bacterium]